MPSEARRSNARQLLARIRLPAVLFVIPNRLSGESLPCFCRSPEPSEGEVEGNLLSRVFRSLFQPCRQSTSLLTPPSEHLAREGRLTQASGLCPTSCISAPQERNISAQRVSAG